MTTADRPAPSSAGPRLPVLGELSPVSRIALGATLLLSALAIALDSGLHADKNVIFVVSAGAILGLAWVVGLSTERLGSLTGPRVGGILNATFGNIAELIIAFFALQAGLIQVVKASLTGSIIGNLLLVLGASILVGGLRHGTQTFSQRIAASNASLLVLAVIAGVVNGLIKPIVKLLSLPLTIMTLGLFGIVINAGLLLLIAWVADLVGITFTVGGFPPDFGLNAIVAALVGAIAMSIVGAIVGLVVHD